MTHNWIPRPIRSGWHIVKWDIGDTGNLVHVHFSDEPDNEYINWGWSPSDDPESIDIDSSGNELWLYCENQEVTRG